MHYVPHAEHVETLIGRNGEAQSAVNAVCPPPILSTGQRVKQVACVLTL